MDVSTVQLASKALSTITIMSCLFLKVPQILSIRKKQSATGIYVQAMLMEIIGFTIVILYNYMNRYSPMTYLEYPIILLQLYVMLYYVLKYQQQLNCLLVPLLVLVYAIAIAAFLTETIPKTALSYIVPLVTPLNSFAKITYIYGIVKVGNADTVSLTTWCISVWTNSSRLFTVYVDSADMKLMINFAVSIVLSTSVLLTAIYYKTVCPKRPKKRKTSNSTCHCKCQHQHDD